MNFFQPSVTLRAKQRDGSRVRRVYDPARTPFQRVAASGVIEATTQARLERIAQVLDPVRLLRQIQTLQDALWRHAVLPPTAMAAGSSPEAVSFDVQASSTERTDDGGASTEALDERRGTEPGRRRYRRTPRKLGPRTYRTRPDRFAGVWEEVRQEFEAQPERTAKAVFQALQERYPGQFPDMQLRTLQRRVKEWRASIIVAFDDQWLSEEVLVDQRVPAPLRAVAVAPAAPLG